MRVTVVPNPHQHFVVVIFFLNANHYSGYEVVPHCGFNLHCMTKDVDCFFICLLIILKKSLFVKSLFFKPFDHLKFNYFLEIFQEFYVLPYSSQPFQ